MSADLDHLDHAAEHLAAAEHWLVLNQGGVSANPVTDHATLALAHAMTELARRTPTPTNPATDTHADTPERDTA